MEAPGLQNTQDDMLGSPAGEDSLEGEKKPLKKHLLGKLLTSLDTDISSSIHFPAVCPALETPTSSASGSARLSFIPSVNPVSFLSTAATPLSADQSPTNNGSRTGLPTVAISSVCTPSTCASQSSPHSVVSSLRASEEADLSPNSAESVSFSPLTSSATARRSHDADDIRIAPSESKPDGVGGRKDVSVEHGSTPETTGLREEGAVPSVPVGDSGTGSVELWCNNHESGDKGGQDTEELTETIPPKAAGNGPEAEVKLHWRPCESVIPRNEKPFGKDLTPMELPKSVQASELLLDDVSASRSSNASTLPLKQPDPAIACLPACSESATCPTAASASASSTGCPLIPEGLDSADVFLSSAASSAGDLPCHEKEASDLPRRASVGTGSSAAPNSSSESSPAPQIATGGSPDPLRSASGILRVDGSALRWSSLLCTETEAGPPSPLAFRDSAVAADCVSPSSSSPSISLRASKLRPRATPPPQPSSLLPSAPPSFSASLPHDVAALPAAGGRKGGEAGSVHGGPLRSSSAPRDFSGMKGVLAPASVKEVPPRPATGLSATRTISRKGAPDFRLQLLARSPARETAVQQSGAPAVVVKSERTPPRAEKTSCTASRRSDEGLFAVKGDVKGAGQSGEEEDEVVRLHRLDVLRHSHDRTTVELYKLEKGRLVEELVRKAKRYPKVPGVYFDRYQQRWCVNWTEGGRRVARYYPVKVHGFDVAYQLAVNCMLSKKPLSAAVTGLAGAAGRAGSAPALPMSTSPGDAHSSRCTPVNSPLHALRSRDAAQRLAAAAGTRAKPDRASSISRRETDSGDLRNSDAPLPVPAAVEAMLCQDAQESLLGMAANQAGFPGDLRGRSPASSGVSPEELNSPLGALMLQQQLLAANSGNALGGALQDLSGLASLEGSDLVSTWLHYQRLARLQQQQQLAAFFSSMPAALGVSRSPLEFLLSGAKNEAPCADVSHGLSSPDPPTALDSLSASDAPAPQTGLPGVPSASGSKGGGVSTSTLAALLASPGVQPSSLSALLPALDVAAGAFSGKRGHPIATLESMWLAASGLETAADAVAAAAWLDGAKARGDAGAAENQRGRRPPEALQQAAAGHVSERGALDLEDAGTLGKDGGEAPTLQTAPCQPAPSDGTALAGLLASVAMSPGEANSGDASGDASSKPEPESDSESPDRKRRRRHSGPSELVRSTSSLLESDMQVQNESSGRTGGAEIEFGVSGHACETTTPVGTLQSGETREISSLAQARGELSQRSVVGEGCVSGEVACGHQGMSTDTGTESAGPRAEGHEDAAVRKPLGSVDGERQRGMIGEEPAEGTAGAAHTSGARHTPEQLGLRTASGERSREAKGSGETEIEGALDQPGVRTVSAYKTDSARSTTYVEDAGDLRGKMLMDLTRMFLLPSSPSCLSSEQGRSSSRKTGEGGESPTELWKQSETEGVRTVERANALALLEAFRGGNARGTGDLAPEALSKPSEAQPLSGRSQVGTAEQDTEREGVLATGENTDVVSSPPASLDVFTHSVYESEAYDPELDKLLTSQPAKDLVREALKMPRVPGVWFDRAQLRWACNYKDSSAFASAASSPSSAERLPGLAKRRAQYFPVKEHGFLRARLLAIQTRRRMESTYRQAAAAALASSLSKHDRSLLGGKEATRFLEVDPGMPAAGRDEDAGDSGSGRPRAGSVAPKGAHVKKRAADGGADKSPAGGGRSGRRQSKKVETPGSWTGASHLPEVSPTSSLASLCSTPVARRLHGGGHGAAATETAASTCPTFPAALLRGLESGTASCVGGLAGAEAGSYGAGAQAAALAGLLAASSLSDSPLPGGVLGVGTRFPSEVAGLAAGDASGISPETAAEAGLRRRPLLPEGGAVASVSGVASSAGSLPRGGPIPATPPKGGANEVCGLTPATPYLLSPSAQSSLLAATFPPASSAQGSAPSAPYSNVVGHQLLVLQKDAIHYILEDLRHNCLSLFQSVLPPALFHTWSFHLIRHAQRVDRAQTFSEVEPFLGVFVDCIRSKKMPSQLSPSVQLQLVRLASALDSVLETAEVGTAAAVPALEQAAEACRKAAEEAQGGAAGGEEEVSQAKTEHALKMTEDQDVEAAREGHNEGHETKVNFPTSRDGLEGDAVARNDEDAPGDNAAGTVSMEPRQLQEGLASYSDLSLVTKAGTPCGQSRESVNEHGGGLSLLNLALLSSLGGSPLTMPGEFLGLTSGREESPESRGQMSDVTASSGLVKDGERDPRASSVAQSTNPDAVFNSFLGQGETGMLS
ncbi:unnamed protein product [Neospora caninum Liverpool]|uniref:AP2 domain transcription factor AP2VIIb-3 n=1 Tax=Neospora caninum (strain Liverpool) TaxID=572307 RepID=F0VH89_NEOCL|nr:uncharacterized protein NCLIV_028720 [Neospora caninum Liverpool]CBZ53083.1 unnamed protein product [Neospora caninum Liverpool]CEL67067.1 TPA: AP2 domain transcription factor AP2VIIb-3 [Neospora caninum Liverpool]|eukprot:XP_003883115.1 uncharacterized protein NCLIV_028720 [Neospora caninum Liverpool]